MKKSIGVVVATILLSVSAFAAPESKPSGERISASALAPASGVAIETAERPSLFRRAAASVRGAFGSIVGSFDDIDVGSAYASAASSKREPAVVRDRSLEFEQTPEVRKFLRYYTQGRGRGTAIRGLVRADPLVERAEEIFREEGVPTDLVWLAQVESGWRPTAVSPVGASGIWQFMPATAERFKMQPTGGEDDERMDFEKATRGAAKYLKWLSKRYDGDWLLAAGAYNCGEGNMDKAIARAGSRDFWTIARRGTLPTETANYVPAVLAASLFGTDPAAFELAGRDAVLMTIGK